MSIKLLTIEELKSIDRKPLESELSLSVLMDFYEKFLMNRLYIFELDFPGQPIIKLRFEEDNLCHLLGFQHIFEDVPNAKSYSGFSGYNFIKSGAVTLDTFKEEHLRDKYRRDRERILYFSYIYQLLEDPEIISFSNKGVGTKISPEFIFYDHKNNRYIHLGLDKHEGTDNYFPRTFFVHKKVKYIDGQIKIDILKKELISQEK